ncbi:hypothetical protein AB656_00550 [Bifidobacterium actinocoloniiforme DSM 22766]|nr:hypothetical protein AB656_00550 [Bifidobacterium actinocoloniiforme DSM 22766]
MNITIDGTVFQARLASGCAAQEFTRRMPTTLRMNELNGTEKYHFFDRPIPSEPQAVGEIRAGDLMLYGSDCLTLFFKTFRTSYAYTRLGWVEQPESLAQTLRPGTVSVNFSFTTV